MNYLLACVLGLSLGLLTPVHVAAHHSFATVASAEAFESSSAHGHAYAPPQSHSHGHSHAHSHSLAHGHGHGPHEIDASGADDHAPDPEDTGHAHGTADHTAFSKPSKEISLLALTGETPSLTVNALTRRFPNQAEGVRPSAHLDRLPGLRAPPIH